MRVDDDLLADPLGEKAHHQGRRERPRLRAQVLDPADIDPGLLHDLPPYAFLRRLARLHEPGEARKARAGAALVAAEEAVFAADGQHDCDWVGARVVLGLAFWAAPFPPGLVDPGFGAALGAEPVPGVPVDQRPRLGENRRLAYGDLRRQRPHVDCLAIPAGQ